MQFRHRDTLMRRVLDMAFIQGTDPVAVVTWLKKDGRIQPGEYVHLDERLLHPSVPAGMFSYDGVIDDPRFPPSS